MRKLMIVAVGQKMPAWAQAGYEDYAKRFPPDMRLELRAVKAEPRTSGKTAQQMMAAEAQRMQAQIPPQAHVVALDERGQQGTSMQLAQRLRGWRERGSDVVFLIGGPDGLDGALRDQAHERLRLSDLTLPHPLVRVLLAEQLYRAWSLLMNHPYHRE
ncbi:23S rRNA (pseudouridine(1915)-N(3))-methyltransferase RlmH [Allofranklinella schreckenbergeri]|uniref:Ribosomal RNA large subunit methyltransferase H n=1 Tax=Allofranklinella schreckenbergeri TaxID=1076744 RepID=A0A3M6R920_9BURK|nr:23S rRNA (pseudouridine(1915)-N(3))-methyltransferase RlmH [Allofranklinella schreckenbergeri]RMW99374.1 23S rRNA (pseudouridine(1915)-N(3))-methyltransferase RlmH [Allofranklinella schreckenbergeri]RMX01335.1 23S rRNA (pseudouridine(1915)-N(3))-methyltransferase RlmH [Allofranklinella schreckenbergeri]RMX11744.1 23S rRNA (pseudouridine(1915)-N(3))-methyltransferase RlmH [Allofranklinella schreckenbergeri]RRD41306.1 23S rRNA (pseudouridine(1915)-N(3))-methyltransferase RlmH [Comamonadaceae b